MQLGKQRGVDGAVALNLLPSAELHAVTGMKPLVPFRRALRSSERHAQSTRSLAAE